LRLSANRRQEEKKQRKHNAVLEHKFSLQTILLSG
jgi:hypothetical protein